MRIVWSTLWFLDYRIPVFKELSCIEDVDFYLIYNKDVNSEIINIKVKETLGDHAIPMTGEKMVGKDSVSGFANMGFRIPYQPGLVKQILELEPDVMVSDGFFQWTYAPLYLRATRKIPHVMCYERTSHTERNAQLIRKLYRKVALRWIDVICCSGKLCGDYVESLGLASKKITFGHMVADVEYLMHKLDSLDSNKNGRLKEEISINGTIYLYVGQIIERKGILQLLNAWSDFTADLSERPSLILVGWGDQMDLIKKMIQEKNLDTVKMIGSVPYNEIVNYYRIADIFIIPTLEDNWSLVVPEAMACELPIITSIYNGCWPELVRETNGWVMDPLDHTSLVQTLHNSYKSRLSFREMGKSSLEIVSRFTPSTAADNIYNSCIMAIKQRKHGDTE